jgi:hypothetical protein
MVKQTQWRNLFLEADSHSGVKKSLHLCLLPSWLFLTTAPSPVQGESSPHYTHYFIEYMGAHHGRILIIVWGGGIYHYFQP